MFLKFFNVFSLLLLILFLLRLTIFTGQRNVLSLEDGLHDTPETKNGLEHSHCEICTFFSVGWGLFPLSRQRCFVSQAISLSLLFC